MIHFFLFFILFHFIHQISTTEHEQRVVKLPYITTPPTCINRPCGRFDGICGHISRLHVLCAGLNRCSQNRILSLPVQSSSACVAQLLTTYFRCSQKNSSLDIAQQASELIVPGKNWGWPAIDWLGSGNQHCKILSGTVSLDLESFVIEPLADHDSPQLLWINCEDLNDNVSLFQDHLVRPRKQFPVSFFSCADKQYRLIGASHVHYHGKYPVLREVINRCLLSKLCAKLFNTMIVWGTHLDAYVRYDDQWYLIDDEIRWKVQALTTQKETLVDHPEETAHALLHYYPGEPSSLLYELVSDEQGEEIASLSSQGSGADAVVLTRETSTAAVAIQAGKTLLKAIVLDGLGGGLLFSPISMAFDNSTYSLMGGVTFASFSLLYHLPHLLPKFKKTLVYQQPPTLPMKYRSMQGPRQRLPCSLL